MATTRKKANKPPTKAGIAQVARANQVRKELGVVGGRPTVVTDEMLVKAQDYVNGLWVHHKLQSGRSRAFPTVEGLAIFLGISRDTIYANNDFSDIVRALKENQHEELANGSATGVLNPLISKLMLSSKHGYVEKTAAETLNTNLNEDVSELDDDAIKAKLDKLRQG